MRQEVGQSLVRSRCHRIVRLCLFLRPEGSYRPLSSDRACKFSPLPANACHKMVKENRFLQLLGTAAWHARLFILLICLFAALAASLARFEPELPRYLDHIEERLTPILQAVQKSSPPMDRLSGWLNPGKIPQVSIRGPSVVEIAMKNAPRFFAILIIVHALAFFLLLYGARLLKKLVDMIPGVSEKQNVVEIASEIEQTAARYFTSVRLINAVFGTECLDLCRFPGAAPSLLWGVAAFLLHYWSFHNLGDVTAFKKGANQRRAFRHSF